MDLLELIDQLEDTVLQGRQARFGGGWTVDRALLMELIDRMRSAVPAEVEDARTILRERNDVLARAEEDAQITLTKARQEADNIVNSHDLVLDAQRRAGEMVEESREQTTQLLEEARAQRVERLGAVQRERRDAVSVSSRDQLAHEGTPPSTSSATSLAELKPEVIAPWKPPAGNVQAPAR